MDNRKFEKDSESLIKIILPVDTTDYSLEDIEHIFNEEIEKPDDEIDFDLVHECILTIDFLKNKED